MFPREHPQDREAEGHYTTGKFSTYEATAGLDLVLTGVRGSRCGCTAVVAGWERRRRVRSGQ